MEADSLQVVEQVCIDMTVEKMQVANALKKKLGLRFRSGKEQTGWYELDGKKILRVTTPHGRGEIPRGTANSIRNQTYLTKDEFDRLIKCPLKGKDFDEIIRQKCADGLL